MLKKPFGALRYFSKRVNYMTENVNSKPSSKREENIRASEICTIFPKKKLTYCKNKDQGDKKL